MENVIFIIEDDPTNSLMIKQSLKKHLDNIQIHEFESVEGAIDNKKLQPDVIILDHFLPKTNGITALPSIKEVIPNCTIAVLSAQQDIELYTKAYEGGAKKYITKNKEMFSNIVSFVKQELVLKNKSGSFWKGFFKEHFAEDEECQKKIVIVNDDEAILLVLDHKLSKSNQLKVNTFLTFDDFLNNYEDYPEVIVLDYEIGQTRLSTSLIHKIKNKYPVAQLVCLSSNENIEIAVSLKQDGVDHYLKKSKTAFLKLQEILLRQH